MRRPLAVAHRLLRLSLFRPGQAVLFFGAATAVSNWLWYGDGLFLPPPVGAALMMTMAVTGGGALLALVRRRRQLTALGLFLSAAVGLPLLALMVLRWKTGAPILMHDGAYQTEEAIRFLLHGQDPYGQDYSLTSMRLWHWYVNQPLDPSLVHYVYYPLTFLLPLPLAGGAAILHLPFDIRVVGLGAMLATCWALLKMPWRWEWQYVALCALALDPLFYFPQGRNDILWLAPVTLGILAWAKNHRLLAGLGMGTALAFKPFPLFFLPLAALAVIRRRDPARPHVTAATLAVLALPAVATILPFLLWQPAHFWADTVGFVAGTDPHSYPIGGFGVARLLLVAHVIPSPDAQVPLGLLQMAAGLPVLIWAGIRVWRRPTGSRILAGGTLVLLVVLACGRFVNDNYVADLLYLAVLAGAARRGESGACEEAGETVVSLAA